jgi:benzoyl-CoA reductase/2-hydroxyglutaryl-CoA dehydratase subunit BcrC/BadD/HgdB
MTIPSEFFASFLIPRQVDRKSARHWFYAETSRLKEQLEKYTGKSISDTALQESFYLYNKGRRLLREIYQIKTQAPSVLSNRQLFDLIRSHCYMDPKDYIPLLEALVEMLPTEPADDGNVKVVLSGIAVEPIQLFDILDELGVSIVGDDLTVGTRMIAYDVPNRKNPIEALTERHFAKSPFSPIRDVGTRMYDFLLQLFEETRADGVIYFHIKFCESQDYDLPDLKSLMRERRIPMIVLDTEYQSVTKAQTKTRLEAFVESLYGERGNG